MIELNGIIISKLLSDKEYAKDVIPYLKEEYFDEPNDKRIVKLILEHYHQFKTSPSSDDIELDLRKLPENLVEDAISRLLEIKEIHNTELNKEKLLKNTERWIQETSVQNAIIKCAREIQEGNVKSFDHFPKVLKEALSVAFDKSIGLDFKDPNCIRERYKKYVIKPEKIKLGIDRFNFITDGGYEYSTLNLYIAPTNVGKTWKLIDDSASLIKLGYNVLYVTLEMSEDNIMQRIEANLFELPTSEFKNLTLKEYANYLRSIKAKAGKKLGRLFVKEYPTGYATVANLSLLLDELELKKNFIPHVLIVDYMGIMKPLEPRWANSYEKQKIISEELRGLMVERKICCISAIQTNREGYNVSDFNLTATSECLDFSTLVKKKVNNKYENIKIIDLKEGDIIKGNNKDVKVKRIFPIKIKKAYRIKLKSGKEIICSADHKFPTSEGIGTINNGKIKIGTKLNSQ